MTDDVSIVVGITGDTSGGRVIKKSLDDIATSGDKAIGSTARLEKAFSGVRTASIGLTGALAGLVGAFGLRELARISDQYVMMGARLKNITGSTTAASAAMRELQRISAETGTSIEASLNIMQRLSFVREEIKATNADMLAFTGTVAKLGVMSGASSDALKFGLTQLGQSLSSQIMRAEEFNSIMENIPGVGKAIADQFGVTTGQLRQLVINGQVLSSDVFAAILNQTNAVNEAMAEMPKTIERAGKEAGITFDTLVAKIMNTTDANQGYVKIIEFGNDRLKEMVDTVDIIRLSFEDMGNRLYVVFNNIAYEIQQLYNKASVAIYDLSGGKIDIGIKSDVFKLDSSQVTNFDRFNTAKANAVRSSMGDQYGPTKPQETRQISKDYAEIAKSIGSTTKLTKAQSEAVKGQKKIQNELTDAVKDSRSETEKLYDTIAEQEKLKPFAKTSEQAQAIGKNIKNAQDELEKLRIKAELNSPVGKAFQSLAKEIDDDFKDAFKSAFTASDGGFKKLLDGWKNAFKNFLADLAYQALVRPILVSLVGGVGGALGLSQGAVASTLGTSGGSAGGGAASILGSGSSIFSAGKLLVSGGLGNSIGNFTAKAATSAYGLFSSDAYAATAFGDQVGDFMANASSFTNLAAGALGGLSASLLGLANKNMYVNAALSTIGGIAGSALGPVGTFVGSFAGSALGGLFGGGKKPSDMSQSGSIDFATLVQTISGQSGKKYSAANASARDGILNQISGVLGLVGQYGGSATGSAAITIGNRDGLRYNGQNYGYDSSAFSTAIFTDLRSSITGLDKTFSTILDKLGVTNSIDTLTKGFEFGQQYNDTLHPKTAADLLSDAIKVLDDTMTSLITTATDLGLPIDEYTKALQKQKDAAIGALKAQSAGFQSLQDMTNAFKSFFDGQALGSNSSLSPTQKLQLAQDNFGGLLTKAQGGDLSVTQDLLKSANELLDIGRNVYASSVSFAGLEGFVRSSVAGVASQAGYAGADPTSDLTTEIIRGNTQLNGSVSEMVEVLRDLYDEAVRTRKLQENIRNQNAAAA